VIAYLILTQYIVTALSAGFNAGYFFRYRSPVRRRRIGALTLALLSSAIFAESLYFPIVALTLNGGWTSGFFFSPSCWLLARLLLCLGSLVVSGLILRHLAAARH
jgi:hypothetical protein